MTDANGPAAATPSTAIDVTATLRSKPYLAVLLLAAALGVPIAAVAYGFLALLSVIQEFLFHDLPDDLFAAGPPAWWPIPWLAARGLLTGLTHPAKPTKDAKRRADQAQRQVGVSDGPTEGATGRPLDVIVCPVPVVGRLGESIDAVLRHREPRGRPQRAPLQREHVRRRENVDTIRRRASRCPPSLDPETSCVRAPRSFKGQVLQVPRYSRSPCVTARAVARSRA